MERFYPGFSWEKRAILLLIGSVLLLGIQWGLPNQKRMDLLLHGQSLTDRQKMLLTTTREEALQRRDIEERYKAQRLGQMNVAPPDLKFADHRGFPKVLSEEDRVIDMRSFIVSGSAWDETITYNTLSRMNPGQMNFDPGGWFYYGGSYLYPLGFLICVAKVAGLCHITNDISYYLDHPNDISTMYTAGRGLNVVALLGILFLLGKLGDKIAGRVCGTTAMLTLACSGLALNQSLLSKPHVYAAFWAFLSLYFIIMFLEGSTRSHLALAAVSAGWAAGASIPAGLIGLLFPVLLFNRKDLRRTILRITMVLCVMIVIFLLTNPYAILSWDRFLLCLLCGGSGEGYGYAVISLTKAVGYLEEVFIRAYGFPVALIGIFGLADATLRGNEVTKRLAIVTNCLLLFISLSLASERISLFLGPLVCLFAGYGLCRIFHYMPSWVGSFRTGILALLFLPGLFFTGLFARDTIWDEHWYEPALAWSNSLPVGRQPIFGVFTRPNPINVPPFPFLNATVVNMHGKISVERLPDYVIVGNLIDGKRVWETHPLYPEYQLAFNLGYRDSYDWISKLRVGNLSQVAAWVYKRSEH
jgi:hypothetical protein